MIIHTGLRTDIPAFYARWFANRLKAGEVCVRNPYNPSAVTRYRISPDVVDLISFCTKNPAPMFPYMELLAPYGQYWFVTITPYDRRIEPNVPPRDEVLKSFCRLSELVGVDCIGWRYDPILVTPDYPVERHLLEFEQMAAALKGRTRVCVISFIDLYQKVRRNFPEAREVTRDDRIRLGSTFARIGEKYGIKVKACGEGDELAPYGVDCSGCMTIESYEQTLHARLKAPGRKASRSVCACYLGCDIGAYDTCGHLCRYCYANASAQAVRQNLRLHDPDSPFLTGGPREGDEIHEAKQVSWMDRQICLTDLFGP